MELKKVLTCPLGSKCQEAVDGELRQCAWYTKLSGENPQTGDVVDEHGCAMTWLPILLVENARTNRSTSAAVESFRNEMVNANNSSQQLLIAAANFAQPKLVQSE